MDPIAVRHSQMQSTLDFSAVVKNDAVIYHGFNLFPTGTRLTALRGIGMPVVNTVSFVTKSFEVEINACGDLQLTFSDIARAYASDYKEDPADTLIAIPSHFSEEQRKYITTAAKTAGLSQSETFSNTQIVNRGLAKEDYPEQNELLIEIGSSAGASTLCTAEVEEGIYFSISEKDIYLHADIDSPSSLIANLVDPILEFLKETPTLCG
ncbi:hypothetical protein BDZ97DRAFT_1913326 [Flammula alnicola]|nr:hypothetical protein BDZ97DRAFT_1913326 [Flammula alnicola]